MAYIELNDSGYGVELTLGEESRFFQGDDADYILGIEEQISKVWSRRFGKGYRKSFGPFKSYEEHLTVSLDMYFD